MCWSPPSLGVLKYYSSASVFQSWPSCHGCLLQLDVVMMAALSQLVPLIPVVGKADTMTPQEASKYREELVQALSDPNTFVGKADDKIAPLQIKVFQ